MELPSEFDFKDVLSFVGLLKSIDWSIKLNDSQGDPRVVLSKDDLDQYVFEEYATELVTNHGFTPNFNHKFKLNEDDDFYLTLTKNDLKIEYRNLHGIASPSPMRLIYSSEVVDLTYVKLLEEILK